MADPPPRYPDPDTDEHTGVGPGHEQTTGAPRWVKVFGLIAIIAIIAVLLVVIVFVTHGPHGGSVGHAAAGDLGAHTPLISITADRTPAAGLATHDPFAGSHR